MAGNAKKDETPAPKPAAKPVRKRRSETTAYVVQMRKTEPGAEVWRDVEVLDVPAGTKRRTVFEKIEGLDLGLVAGEAAMVRAIPMEFAESEPVAMVQPAPQLKVG